MIVLATPTDYQHWRTSLRNETEVYAVGTRSQLRLETVFEA